MHRDEVRHEPLDLAHHLLVGQPQVEERARERPRRGEQLRLAPHQLAEPPARGLREREQPQRLARRRAVDDDHVPLALLDVALEPQQAEQLVAAGRHGQLLGRDPLHAALDQHLPEPALHRRPVALELLLRRDLLRPQVRRQLGRLAPDRRLEHVGERVGGIGGQHDRAQPGGGAAAGGGGGDRRLADAALARVEDRARGHRAAPQPTSLRRFGLSTSTALLDARGVAGEVGGVDPHRVDARACAATVQATVRVPRPTVPAATDSTRLPVRRGDADRRARDLRERELQRRRRPAAHARCVRQRQLRRHRQVRREVQLGVAVDRRGTCGRRGRRGSRAAACGS